MNLLHRAEGQTLAQLVLSGEAMSTGSETMTAAAASLAANRPSPVMKLP